MIDANFSEILGFHMISVYHWFILTTIYNLMLYRNYWVAHEIFDEIKKQCCNLQYYKLYNMTLHNSKTEEDVPNLMTTYSR